MNRGLYYKVVRRRRSRGKEELTSSSIYSNDYLNHIYEPGTWTECRSELLERQFGLCVFETEGAAKRCARAGEEDLEVWECEIGAEIPYIGQGYNEMACRASDLVLTSPAYTWYPGMVMTDCVKLLRLVKDEDGGDGAPAAEDALSPRPKEATFGLRYFAAPSDGS